MATSGWHRVGDEKQYQLSFDLRADASRFVLIRRFGNSAVLVSLGLIDGWPATYVLPDEPVDQPLPAGVSLEIIRLWEATRTALVSSGCRS